jgi:hypothetical protein
MLTITLLIPSYSYSKNTPSKEYAPQTLEVIETMEDAAYDLDTLVKMIYMITDRQCLKHLYDIKSKWRYAAEKLKPIISPAEAQYVHNLVREALDKYTKSTEYMIKSCWSTFSKNEYFSESIFLMRQGDRLFSKVREEFGKTTKEAIYE